MPFTIDRTIVYCPVVRVGKIFIPPADPHYFLFCFVFFFFFFFSLSIYHEQDWFKSELLRLSAAPGRKPEYLLSQIAACTNNFLARHIRHLSLLPWYTG